MIEPEERIVRSIDADTIEGKLELYDWLGGLQPSKEDAETFASFGDSVPSAETHPNAFAWYSLVNRFSEAVRGTWPVAPQLPAANAVSYVAAAPGKAGK